MLDMDLLAQNADLKKRATRLIWILELILENTEIVGPDSVWKAEMVHKIARVALEEDRPDGD